MFSGIVEEIGVVVGAEDTTDGRHLKIKVKSILEGVKQGDSICVSGACLTVTKYGADWFETDCSFQTLRCTKLGQLRRDSKVNLEKSLQLSDRLGGHLVTGHVDGIAKVKEIKKDGFSSLVTFVLPIELANYVVDKGSITFDGVSLTVANLDDSQGEVEVSVAFIPHTLTITTFGGIKVGDMVNVETDMIGKYAARWLTPHLDTKDQDPKLSLAILQEHGYV